MIDKYIELAKNMPNTSDGGSPCYHFDDVVLVKYTLHTEFGTDARKNEELIAREANKLNERGVRTPKHLEIKREIVDDIAICWVLQERAKGRCFSYYTSIQDCNESVLRQGVIACAPQEQYDQMIRDLCELEYFGIETKPKNIYYDQNKENGGFTFIDLLGYGAEGRFDNKLEDYSLLLGHSSFIFKTGINWFNEKNATQEEIAKSKQLSYMMRLKVIQGMRNTIPNFEDYERWVLRTLDKDVLDYFKKVGFYTKDLTLTEEESSMLREALSGIVKNCLKEIMTGKCVLWQIYANEIRIAIDNNLLVQSFMYDRNNPRKLEDFADEGEFANYEFKKACEKDLEEEGIRLFNERLEALDGTLSDPEQAANVSKAIEELRRKQSQKK